MKKVVFLIISIMCVVFLAGCGSSPANINDTEAPAIDFIDDNLLIFYADEYSESELIKHISVIDDMDGDISETAVFQPKDDEADAYNAKTHGKYILKCVASDRAGNESKKDIAVILIDESLREMQGYWQSDSGEMLEIRRIDFNGDRSAIKSDGSFETSGYEGSFKYTILNDGTIERKA